MSRKREDFRLGAVLVEPGRLRLTMEKRLVAVQPRVMDLLVVLASRKGHVVSREELEAEVWAGAHVGYHALPRAISEIRKAFEGVGTDSDLIETIPRRGYRLTIEPVAVKAPPLRTVLPMSRLSSAVLGLLVVGLAAHALSLHGSSIHLAGAAAIIGMSFFTRT